jgi:hypothetical protein
MLLAICSIFIGEILVASAEGWLIEKPFPVWNWKFQIGIQERDSPQTRFPTPMPFNAIHPFTRLEKEMQW